MPEIPLLSLPPAEARALLATGVPAYLPVNPVEYHGPHLTLWNDALGGAALARDLHLRLREVHPDWPFVTLPDLGLGCGTVPGPGSRRVPFVEVRNAVVRACRALVDLGAQRVIINAFHGDPLHNLALWAGVQALAARGVRAFVPMHAILSHMMQHDPAEFEPALETVVDPAERAALRAELKYDFHAGFLETSFMLHYRPDSVSPAYKSVPPCPPIRPPRFVDALARAAKRAGCRSAAELDYAAYGLGWFGLEPFPGYSTRPHLANAEAGRLIVEAIQAQLLPAALAVLDRGEPPAPPPMLWLRALTLDGRLDLTA